MVLPGYMLVKCAARVLHALVLALHRFMLSNYSLVDTVEYLLYHQPMSHSISLSVMTLASCNSQQCLVQAIQNLAYLVYKHPTLCSFARHW